MNKKTRRSLLQLSASAVFVGKVGAITNSERASKNDLLDDDLVVSNSSGQTLSLSVVISPANSDVSAHREELTLRGLNETGDVSITQVRNSYTLDLRRGGDYQLVATVETGISRSARVPVSDGGVSDRETIHVKIDSESNLEIIRAML